MQKQLDFEELIQWNDGITQELILWDLVIHAQQAYQMGGGWWKFFVFQIPIPSMCLSLILKNHQKQLTVYFLNSSHV
jgi:hypothetical protein